MVWYKGMTPSWLYSSVVKLTFREMFFGQRPGTQVKFASFYEECHTYTPWLYLSVVNLPSVRVNLVASNGHSGEICYRSFYEECNTYRQLHNQTCIYRELDLIRSTSSALPW